ncbi:hypothetical protein FSS13T_00720 [Flavobacterium saliperosum S13]|uniref:DUF3857 domain-containing protein n=2 Tax=Flavobacterium saliperosum TaxID=329186 RepID=A0A1G4V488_9FLAO|nr:hypothetical protein [Flavobacterium saliperosum]ESU28611.1 hypothetical protein FSS13T_00720 [Flavobacterium saliperosum S13]SCX00000.1 hypothetical protein SAMN02927925_00075 [Flavobacterium saliperosum]
MSLKMLKLALFFCSATVFAQDKEEIKDFFWGKNDTYKSVTEIPEKWKNESAVVIYKYEDYDFHKFGKSVTYRSAIRRRVKLQDQAAVTEFSEFTYAEKSNPRYGTTVKTVIGIKVLKPDGKEIEINVDKEAVTVDNHKKIAIPSLEIGDIIDIYDYSTESFQSAYDYGFDEVERTLGGNHPIMNYKLTFQTENDFFVNFNTYNGGPELKEIPLEKSGERKYEIVATDIDKNDFPTWFYPLVELPCYKFQVFFARSGKFEKMADAFLPEKETIVKKTVSKEDVLNYYMNKFRPLGNLGDIEKFLKNKTFASTEEKVRAVYYYTRHYYYTMYVEAFVASEAKIMYPFTLYGNNPIFFRSDIDFIDFFMAFLKDNKIEYDIIVGTNRHNGPIKDLLIQKNATVLLRVNTENPIYIDYFSPFSDLDKFSAQLENTDAYALKVTKLKKVVDVDNVRLPSSTYKDNTSKQVTTVKINDGFNTLQLNRETALNGHNKDEEQSEKLYFFDYVKEDYAKYGTVSLLERVKNKKKKEQYSKEFDALINKLKDRRKEEFKTSTGKEYGLEIEDHSLEIVNTGRFGKATPFVYKEDFSIKNKLIKKAGENYIFEIGKLIGSQFEVSKKEKNRTNNIYFSFPRSFDDEIILEIPEGYAATGLEKLNKNVVNETGGFTSTAVVEGNKLIIKTFKYYADYFQPNKNWSKMVDFLDAAYQFNQEKVLLKKI